MRLVMAFVAVGVLLCLCSLASAQASVDDSRNSATTCYATGDINGDGISLSVGDFSALIAFVNAGVLRSGRSGNAI